RRSASAVRATKLDPQGCDALLSLRPSSFSSRFDSLIDSLVDLFDDFPADLRLLAYAQTALTPGQRDQACRRLRARRQLGDVADHGCHWRRRNEPLEHLRKRCVELVGLPRPARL